MPHTSSGIATALYGGGGSMVGVATSFGLHLQLNQTHQFLHMNLPMWWFFVAVVALSLFGSLASLLTDTMRTGARRKLINFIMGFFFGLLGAFVLLPSFSSHPSMGVMMMTALAFSFSGTVLLHNLGRIIRSDDFKHGTTDTASQAGRIIKNRILAVVRAVVGDDGTGMHNTHHNTHNAKNTHGNTNPSHNNAPATNNHNDTDGTDKRGGL